MEQTKPSQYFNLLPSASFSSRSLRGKLLQRSFPPHPKKEGRVNKEQKENTAEAKRRRKNKRKQEATEGRSREAGRHQKKQEAEEGRGKRKEEKP